jgi:hypothetical protein
VETRLLVTDLADGRLALLTDQMAYHHLAQGSIHEMWAASLFRHRTEAVTLSVTDRFSWRRILV